MIAHMRLRGGDASLSWGYRAVGTLRAWRIARPEGGEWTLVARPVRLDQFQIRQACARRELLFHAPRAGGFWTWPILGIDITPDAVRARLGAPEQ